MSQLSNICEDEITKQLKDVCQGVKWSCRSKFFDSSSKIDILGVSQKNIYIIEIELSREDPVNNVAKIFFQLDKGKTTFSEKRIWFFHIFSKKFSTGNKRQIAEFIGNKMSDEYSNLKYTSLTLDIIPRKDRDITEDFINSCYRSITLLTNHIFKMINPSKS